MFCLTWVLNSANNKELYSTRRIRAEVQSPDLVLFNVLDILMATAKDVDKWLAGHICIIIFALFDAYTFIITL